MSYSRIGSRSPCESSPSQHSAFYKADSQTRKECASAAAAYVRSVVAAESKATERRVSEQEIRRWEFEDHGQLRTIYVAAAALRQLVALATSPQLDPGTLWRRFSAIPLERPLPSRLLDEELRVALTAHATDGRPPARR